MVSGECCGGVQLLLVQLVKLFSKMEERFVHIVRFLLCVWVRERSKVKFKTLDHSLFSRLYNSYRMVVSIVSDLYKSVRCTYYWSLEVLQLLASGKASSLLLSHDSPWLQIHFIGHQCPGKVDLSRRSLRSHPLQPFWAAGEGLSVRNIIYNHHHPRMLPLCVYVCQEGGEGASHAIHIAAWYKGVGVASSPGRAWKIVAWGLYK